MKRKVITYKNLPQSLNIYGLITLWLLFDRFNIPQWGWGIYWTLVFFAIIGLLINIHNEEKIDIFK